MLRQSHFNPAAHLMQRNGMVLFQGHLVGVRGLSSGSEKKKADAERGDVGKVEPEEKLGLFARFKQMSKQYWYVLLPVHVVTSCFWFGGFYYLSSR